MKSSDRGKLFPPKRDERHYGWCGEYGWKIAVIKYVLTAFIRFSSYDNTVSQRHPPNGWSGVYEVYGR